MKRVLITGGSGTIGRAFIKKYQEIFKFYNYSRNEKAQDDLKKTFPDVVNFIGSLEDSATFTNVLQKVKPDIIIHAAAMKHINIAEENPIQCCHINILGSLNVLNAAVLCQTPITIVISTDKACDPESVYGKTKSLMEDCFINANNDITKFAACRFANVTHSNGSVLPFWLSLKDKKLPLKLTDPTMNRLMFSQDEAASLIKKSIDICENDGGGFILSKKMKTVNMLELAQCISDKVEITGKRTGEKTDEMLINEKEINFSYLIDGNYIMLKKIKNDNDNKLSGPLSSLTAEKMTTEEMQKIIEI